MTITGANLYRLKVDHLDQLLSTSAHDGALQRCLNDATSQIEREIGYTFPAANGASTAVVYGTDSTMLRLPPHTLTVTAVAVPSGYTAPTYYVNSGGYLRITDSAGVILPRYSTSLAVQTWAYSGVWQSGVPYTLTGTFTAAPGEIVRLCLELATALWNFRSAGGMQSVGGVEGVPVVTVRNDLTPRQREVLDAYRLGGPSAGVW